MPQHQVLAGKQAKMPRLARSARSSARRPTSARLAELLAQAPVFIGVLCGPELILDWANEPLLLALGGRKALGEPMADLLLGAAGTELLADLEDAYRSGETRSHPDLPLSLSEANGAELPQRWVDLVVQPTRDADGRVSGLLLHGVDATAYHRAARALRDSEARCRAAQDEVERAGRLADEFLRALSHEMRTPLAAVAGWAHLLERGGLSERDRQAGIAAIVRNTQVQAQLIADLLDMRSIETGRLKLHTERIDAADAARTALEAVRQAAQARDIRLDSDIDSQAGVLVADRPRLQQIIDNLLRNAIRFTPRGGQVHLSLRRADAQVEIEVVDSGQGIEPAFLPRVFERLRHPADGSIPRPHGGGMGIGLSLVRQLVELHGGSVHAHSAGVGQGARLQVVLPIAGPPQESAGSVTGAQRPKPQRELDGVTVLAIDDDPDGRALLRRVLEAAGGEVTVAASALEGMEMVRRQRPQVVLADIGMPEHDGYEFVGWLRRLHPDAGGQTPAAALTAFAHAEDRQRALRAGFQSHLVKPVDARRLVSVVASLAQHAPGHRP